MRSIRELASLEGRTALVTGGAGHIGRAISEGLAELGASLILLDRDAGLCAEARELISGKTGARVMPLVTDLERIDAADIAKKVKNMTDGLDILINCAAFVGTDNLDGWNVPFEEQSADTWRRAVEVNMTAPFILSRTFAPMLTERGRGSVINFASIYGICGPDLSIYEGADMHNPAAYAAAKGGLIQFTRWLSTVLAPRARVNAITPGGVERGQQRGFIERYEAKTPMGRMATEEDIKGAAAFLASDLSAYVTGQNIVVDGGWSVW